MIKIWEKIITFWKTLNKFDWESISLDWKIVGAIKIDKKNNYFYIDRFEIEKLFRWKWIWKEVLKIIFEKTNKVELSSEKEAINFWLKMWAKDLWRDCWVFWLWERHMSIEKKDFLNTISGKQLPKKLETFFDKPYNQSKDNFKDNDSSYLYKSVWNDNKLPIWTKLYTPSKEDINEYTEWWKYPYKWKLYSLTTTGKDFIIAKRWMKVTRYWNIKYEDWFYKSKLDKLEFAFKKFDAMVNGDMIEVYR